MCLNVFCSDGLTQPTKSEGGCANVHECLLEPRARERPAYLATISGKRSPMYVFMFNVKFSVRRTYPMCPCLLQVHKINPPVHVLWTATVTPTRCCTATKGMLTVLTRIGCSCKYSFVPSSAHTVLYSVAHAEETACRRPARASGGQQMSKREPMHAIVLAPQPQALRVCSLSKILVLRMLDSVCFIKIDSSTSTSSPWLVFAAEQAVRSVGKDSPIHDHIGAPFNRIYICIMMTCWRAIAFSFVASFWLARTLAIEPAERCGACKTIAVRPPRNLSVYHISYNLSVRLTVVIEAPDVHTYLRVAGNAVLLRSETVDRTMAAQHATTWFCSTSGNGMQDAFLERLSKETVRNHLDMRHRLDKHGKRYGKVINYRYGCPALALWRTAT